MSSQTKKPAEPQRDRRAAIADLVFEAGKPSTLIVAVGRGNTSKLVGLPSDLLVDFDLRQVRRVVCASQSGSLMAKSSFWVWHLTSSLGAACACAG